MFLCVVYLWHAPSRAYDCSSGWGCGGQSCYIFSCRTSTEPTASFTSDDFNVFQHVQLETSKDSCNFKGHGILWCLVGNEPSAGERASNLCLWTWTIDDHRTSLWPNLGELRAVMALLTRGPTVSEPGNIGNAPGLQWITCRYMPLHASAHVAQSCSIPGLFVTPALLWESLKPRCMAHISATAFHCSLWAAATAKLFGDAWRLHCLIL